MPKLRAWQKIICLDGYNCSLLLPTRTRTENGELQVSEKLLLEKVLGERSEECWLRVESKRILKRISEACVDCAAWLFYQLFKFSWPRTQPSFRQRIIQCRDKNGYSFSYLRNARLNGIFALINATMSRPSQRQRLPPKNGSNVFSQQPTWSTWADINPR